MKMRSLTAIKPHKYGTRHLTAGEDYEAPSRHAVALVASKKARFAAKARAAAAPVVSVEEKAAAQSDAGAAAAAEPETALDRLRLEATQLSIDVDRRWGVPRLTYEIERAKS